ncbi:hypothetical protein [Streptomyces sp. NPDC050546]|uniref:hypothetical protein n=1 Tax=Streptomyces sp. NPDC050546 TaxID=3365628 RepID=UPI0037B421C8
MLAVLLRWETRPSLVDRTVDADLLQVRQPGPAEFGNEAGVELRGMTGEFGNRPVVLDREFVASGDIEPGTGRCFVV